ncbi:MAG: molybdopterin molybdenumtransferase MoeA, partial [Verrucomicrobiota bacterium]|nr:molybdopterin molybdenumtransferase MoeA [Verrucomicrobiota bacterium]
MKSDLIDLEVALGLVLERTTTLDSKPVALDDALGRVLRRDVLSDIDSPPFDSSAMDGYAIRSTAGSDGFRCVGEIAAGNGEDFL